MVGMLSPDLLTAAASVIIHRIATSLTDPVDLLSFLLVHPRFVTKCIAAPLTSSGGGGSAAAAASETEMWSIPEEAARLWIAECSEQERGWVPRRGRESWLGLMLELQLLRRAAVFGRSHKTAISVSDHRAGGSLVSALRYAAWLDNDYGWFRSAASKVVMRAGRHYAVFTLGESLPVCGVIRPDWDVEGGQHAHHAPPRGDGCASHCFFYAGSGVKFPGNHEWEGMQSARMGDRVGLLLDLDQGSMTVYKNGERLGVMVSGLSGEYCWAVVLGEPGEWLRIAPAILPTTY
jgi:hypothetical protein